MKNLQQWKTYWEPKPITQIKMRAGAPRRYANVPVRYFSEQSCRGWQAPRWLGSGVSGGSCPDPSLTSGESCSQSVRQMLFWCVWPFRALTVSGLFCVQQHDNTHKCRLYWWISSMTSCFKGTIAFKHKLLKSCTFFLLEYDICTSAPLSPKEWDTICLLWIQTRGLAFLIKLRDC